MSERARWLARARAIVDDVGPVLASFGVALDPALVIDTDDHPCPGYRHDLRAILFCPPVIETGVDRLRWMFFCRIMGCADVDEAGRFYDVALPLIVCHELAHHLRFTLEVADDSSFVEEQVCDRLAVGLVEAMPAHRATLAPLRAACEHMHRRLAERYGQGDTPAFVPDLGDQVAHGAAIDRQRLERLHQLAVEHDIALEAVLELAVGEVAMADAAADRVRVQQRVDSRYTDDPSEYWYLSLSWVASYLGRAQRPMLADLLRDHLLERAGADRTAEVIVAVRGLLDDPVPARRIAGAEGLLELCGEAAVADVVAAIAAAPTPGERAGLLAALAHAWPRDRGWDPSAVAGLVDGEAARAPRAALRLAGVAGAPPPAAALAARDPDDLALAIEQLAAAPMPEPAALTAALADGERAPLLLDAWAAWGRRSDQLPAAAYRPLLADPSPLLRARLWRVGAPAELAGILPARGHPDWAGAIARLAGHSDALAAAAADPERLPVWRLRAAAALADLGQPSALPRLRGQQVARASWLLAVARVLARERGEPAALAAEQLRVAARRIAVEIVRAGVGADDAAALHPLAERACDGGAPPAIVIELLGNAAPAALRDIIALLLAGQAPPGAADLETVATLDVTQLPALVGAVLTATRPGGEMLTTVEKAIQLRTVPMFARLEPARLWRIAEACVEQRYAAGEVVFGEGEPGAQLYLVVSGRIQVDKRSDSGETVLLADLGHPSCFGEMALFDGAPRSATARAAEPCRLLILAGSALTRVGRESPEVYEALLRAFSERLRATSEQLAG